jgi:hypothetical protein
VFGFRRKRPGSPCRITNDTASPPLTPQPERALPIRERVPRRTDGKRRGFAADSDGSPVCNRRDVSHDKLVLLAEHLAGHVTRHLDRYYENLLDQLKTIARADEANDQQRIQSLTEQTSAAIAGRLDQLGREVQQRLVGYASELAAKAAVTLADEASRYWSSLEQRTEETCSTTAQHALQRPIIDALVALYDRVCQEARFQSLWYRKDPELTSHLGCRQVQERCESASRSYAAELLRILQSLNVEPIVGGGGQFNPHHQRVVDVEMTSQSELDGHTARIVRPGFTWNSTILRPEEVIVFKLERKNHEKEI